MYPGNYREFLDSIGWDEDDENKPLPAKPQKAVPAAIPQQTATIPPKSVPERPVKNHNRKMTKKALADFIAMRSKILKPLHARIKSLEDEIISCEEKVKAVNEDLVMASTKGGLGALRRSELSRELKDLTENIDSYYSQLDAAMKAYDAAKLKYSDE